MRNYETEITKKVEERNRIDNKDFLSTEDQAQYEELDKDIKELKKLQSEDLKKVWGERDKKIRDWFESLDLKKVVEDWKDQSCPIEVLIEELCFTQAEAEKAQLVECLTYEIENSCPCNAGIEEIEKLI